VKVFDGHGALVLMNNLSGNLALDNPAEEAIHD
jgi:hypothetical protein